MIYIEISSITPENEITDFPDFIYINPKQISSICSYNNDKFMVYKPQAVIIMSNGDKFYSLFTIDKLLNLIKEDETC